MKTTKIILMLFAFFTFAVSAQAKGDKKSKKTEQIAYVVNIHCNDCKEKIENKIPFEKGVKNLNVDMETNKVTVTFDPKKTDKESIKKALQKLEFQVKEVPSCCAGK